MPTGIYPRTEEHNRKISEINKGKTKSPETRKKLSEANKGKKHSENELIKMRESSRKRWEKLEERKKISDANKGRYISPEWRANISMGNKGKKIPPETRLKMSITNTGKKRSEESRLKQSVSCKGRVISKETRRKIGDAHRGEKCHLWKGGISFEPYCVLFNEEFKERCRAYFGYICVECGAPQNGRCHPIHHVNYNKMVCCNEVKPMFVCLCNSCNSKANFNRPYWEQHFTDMINNYYGGKCYLTREEMKAYIL
jgi:hypothetical protein